MSLKIIGRTTFHYIGRKNSNGQTVNVKPILLLAFKRYFLETHVLIDALFFISLNYIYQTMQSRELLKKMYHLAGQRCLFINIPDK